MDSSGKKEIHIFSLSNANTANPFSAQNSVIPQNSNSTQTPLKRLNGYDSAILNKTVYDNSEEKELSLDIRIREKEFALNDLDSKIKQADDYGNQNEALGLKAKRQRIAQELSDLKRTQAYSGRVLGENIKEKMPVVHKVTDFVSRNILAKISKKIHSIVTLNDSLEQLSDISKSVDELIDLNVPYGEKIQNYEKLTEYLNRANKIHSNISRSLGRKIS